MISNENFGGTGFILQLRSSSLLPGGLCMASDKLDTVPSYGMMIILSTLVYDYVKGISQILLSTGWDEVMRLGSRHYVALAKQMGS
jgi:hypothetical protein